MLKQDMCQESMTHSSHMGVFDLCSPPPAFPLLQFRPLIQEGDLCVCLDQVIGSYERLLQISF